MLIYWPKSTDYLVHGLGPSPLPSELSARESASIPSVPVGSVTLTIDPKEIAVTSELSIGYFTTKTVFPLIQQGAPLRCTNTPGG
jgi:hypothetical protein